LKSCCSWAPLHLWRCHLHRGNLVSELVPSWRAVTNLFHTLLLLWGQSYAESWPMSHFCSLNYRGSSRTMNSSQLVLYFSLKYSGKMKSGIWSVLDMARD
jgi:hypothetical protein